ncbi:MAG: ankyrin repeat domain-containing protein [Candidatus Babeliales bacterium]
MKFFNKQLIVLFFLAVLTISINAMEAEKYEQCEVGLFEGLPSETKEKIATFLASSDNFGQALKCLANLSQVNKQWHEMLNDKRTLKAIAKALDNKDKKYFLSVDKWIFLLAAELPGARKYLLEQHSIFGEYIIKRHLEGGLLQVFSLGMIKGLQLTEDQIVNLIRLLLNLGMDINSTGIDNNTLLHYAAKYNLPKVVSFILAQSNIDINIIEYDEAQTALDIAKEKGYQEIVKLIEQAEVKK